MAPEVLAAKLRTLQEVLVDLQPHVSQPRAAQEKAHYEIERQVQLAVDLSLGAAKRILSLRGIPLPATGREVFLALAKSGAVDASLASRLADSVGLRNLIVHEYGALDMNRFFDGLEQGYRAFVDFVDAASRMTAP